MILGLRTPTLPKNLLEDSVTQRVLLRSLAYPAVVVPYLCPLLTFMPSAVLMHAPPVIAMPDDRLSRYMQWSPLST